MKNFVSSFFGAVIFYSRIPLPSFISISFFKIALWLPWIGVLLASLLSVFALILDVIGFPPLTKIVLLVFAWICVTGGLHFDGAIDAGDAWGVQGDQKKRLEVMQDSRVGAYGLISGIFLVLLKIVSLYELSIPLWWGLMISMSWGRWGQLGAISLYPYVREEGKGAFLKKDLNFPLDGIIGSLFIIFLIIIQIYFLGNSLTQVITTNIIGASISLMMGWLIQKPLGGHTGDTYGATVEWSEALILCFLSIKS
ncbi:adenosylcobinamide-GDP ribazoletransferase [Cyanobacterium aponinum]|uniref:Adenosylcobinamide-GDP ribazoletransferase n=1 Tax=Cyanobacterium aponinum 0216 TaxID=2676140 RepID=A0A844H1C7_9CHRO|nr:adenosylcobinamide-GDP ribazoletransferase [Cyanobacterium aponinum]MTF40165.1 adenosylcobinamide-GDP ribazoletransferase [Cyanobacterium aponinum 0216]